MPTYCILIALYVFSAGCNAVRLAAAEALASGGCPECSARRLAVAELLDPEAAPRQQPRSAKGSCNIIERGQIYAGIPAMNASMEFHLLFMHGTTQTF